MTADQMQEPIPCSHVEEYTIREWLAKLDEEVTELKEALIRAYGNLEEPLGNAAWQAEDKFNQQVLWEGTDIITAVTSLLAYAGFPKSTRQSFQQKVNESNRKKGRW